MGLQGLLRMDRRTFLATAGLLATPRIHADAPGIPERGQSRAAPAIRAVAFDGFPIIDPRPIAERAEQVFPGKGTEFMAAWRTRQFEYAWLRTLGNRYANFWETTEAALVYAARSLGLSLPAEAQRMLMASWLELRAWPDAREALERLRRAGIRMAFLSNLTAPMLDAAVRNSQLQGYFEPHLSTDRIGACKPDPRAYRMGVTAFGVNRDQIMFCAAAGWDVAGARWFGYPTYWINRAAQPAEQLGASPDGTGAGMAEFGEFVLARA
jgi:2-haloacid dehalogenase